MTLANGLGGFADDGRAYAIVLEGDQETPLPWANVIANPHFGTIVTASGSAHTWSENSRENRLTSFANDPVVDPTAEALFIRDDESGDAWSPTPGPMTRHADERRNSSSAIRPASRGSRASTRGIRHELEVFVDVDDPVKFSLLTLTNDGAATRTLSLFAYNDWVLGPPRESQTGHVVTAYDAASGTILARNAYNDEFARRVAFAHASETPRSATGDRRSFIGRNGSLSTGRRRCATLTLEPQFGAGLDPCAALHVQVRPGAGRAPPRRCFCWARAPTRDHVARADRAARNGRRRRGGAANEVAGVLGHGRSRRSRSARRTIHSTCWSTAGCVYQDVSCRLWARAATTSRAARSASAINCRTSWRCCWRGPTSPRAHLLRAAGRQFVEGDVQHWWHEPSGRGLRSRCSDDLLWLPFVVAEYVRTTGDAGVLDERVPFLEAPLLAPDAAGGVRPAARVRRRRARCSSTASGRSTRA